LETAQQLALEEENDLWDGGGTRGSCLSVSDRFLLRKHLQTLITGKPYKKIVLAPRFVDDEVLTHVVL